MNQYEWLEVAKKYRNAGLSIIPTNADKTPMVATWREYMDRIANEQELETWAKRSPHGIAVITGAVSGNLVCFDLDSKNLPAEERDQFEADFENSVSDLVSGLIQRLILVQTISGGVHYIARHKNGPSRPGKALAKSIIGRVIFETREEKNYIVASPTECYNIIYGEMTEIPEITEDEYFTILSCISALNQQVEEPVKHLQVKSTNRPKEGGISPLDDYDNRATEDDVLGLLTGAGWKILRRSGQKVSLQRPGKSDRILSATWNHIPGRFYCFSSSTNFEPQKAYKPCGVYAVINHNGDFKATAKDLVQKGFGERDYYKKDSVLAPPIPTVNVNDLLEKMKKIKREGFPPPTQLGIDFLKDRLSIYQGQLNLISGVPGSGKSELLDQIATSMSIFHSVKWVYFSPESHPFEYHIGRLIEKFTKKRFFGKLSNVTDEDLEKAISFIQNTFVFCETTEEAITLQTICEVVKANKCNGLLIDPWNELESLRPPHQNESEYIGESLRLLRKFLQKENCYNWICAHPTKMRRNKDGVYERITMYDLAGSAHWYNKTDNSILLHRNKNEDNTMLQLAKIKNKICGKITTEETEIKLFFDTDNGTFREYNLYDGITHGRTN